MGVIRIGALGAATILPIALVRPARAVDGIAVTAVASRDRRKAEKVAARHALPVVHGSYTDLIADPSIDAVYIPLPNGLHAEWALRAIEAGKHVLCEKPFTANRAEAERVAAAADAVAPRGQVVMEAFHYRYHPLAERIQTILHGPHGHDADARRGDADTRGGDGRGGGTGERGGATGGDDGRGDDGRSGGASDGGSGARGGCLGGGDGRGGGRGGGELGAVGRVEVAVCVPFAQFRNIRYRYELGGGATMDTGCYALHMARLLGGEDPSVVSARATPFRGDPRIDRAMRAELAYPSGASGTVHASLWSRRVLSVRARVVGERGELSVTNLLVPHFFHRLRVRTAAGTRTERVAGASTYIAQLRAFAAAIKDGTPFPTTAADAVTTMGLIDDVYRAAGLPLRGT